MTRSINLPLLILALAIAVAIKFSIHEEKQLSERLIDAQVTYSPPDANMVSYQLVESVKVLVRGAARDVSRLTMPNVSVHVNIPKGQPGRREISLDPKNVRFSIPGSFDVVSVDPNRFTIVVEPRQERSLPVRVVLTGEPAAGARHLAPEVRPTRARVSGPSSRVRGLSELIAEVSLDGHARTFEELVQVTAEDPLVQVVQPNLVTVVVPMEEPELSISFQEMSDQPEAGQ